MSNEPLAIKTIWNANLNGDSSGLKHWRSNKIYHFTFITELSVYEPIPGL
jgi:hypothetical protein